MTMMPSGVMAHRQTRSLVIGSLVSQMTGLDSVSKFIEMTACIPGPCTGVQTSFHLYVNSMPVSKVSHLFDPHQHWECIICEHKSILYLKSYFWEARPCHHALHNLFMPVSCSVCYTHLFCMLHTLVLYATHTCSVCYTHLFCMLHTLVLYATHTCIFLAC